MKKRIFTLDKGWKEVRAYALFEHFGEYFFVHRSHVGYLMYKYTCSHDGTGAKVAFGTTIKSAKEAAILKLNEDGESKIKQAISDRHKDIIAMVESEKTDV